MQLINTPIGLSAVDDFILKHIPENAQCGIVVYAGDGRLGKKISERCSNKVVVYNIEPREELYKRLEGDEKQKSQDPWDVDLYLKIAEKYKGLDFICFINIHEYWDGNLYSLQRILSCLKPDGLGFLSFYNKNSLYEMRQAFPPNVSGFDELASPINNWAKLDLIAWIIYFLDIGMIVEDIWGILEEKGFNFCQQKKKQPTTWQERGLTIKVDDMGEAFIYSAPVICLKFKNLKQGDVLNPKFFAVKYNASILQAILFPYLDILPSEVAIFRAHLEKAQGIEKEANELVLLNFLITQLDDFQDVKNILIVGCDWGSDLLALKQIRPNWAITGVDSSAELIAIGKDVMKTEGITVKQYSAEGKLPFDDKSFDLVISLRHFSVIYYPLAEVLAEEMLRVAKKGVVLFEDLRGPEFSMQLKLYSIPDIFKSLGFKPDVRFLKIKEEDTELYIVKVKK